MTKETRKKQEYKVLLETPTINWQHNENNFPNIRLSLPNYIKHLMIYLYLWSYWFMAHNKSGIKQNHKRFAQNSLTREFPLIFHWLRHISTNLPLNSTLRYNCPFSPSTLWVPFVLPFLFIRIALDNVELSWMEKVIENHMYLYESLRMTEC